MSKRYYWLKLKEDFFRQRAIKKLRRIAGGDTFTIVYLKMLLLAMKDNGKIALDGADFSEELALELDEEPDNVKMTVAFLMNSGLMEEVGENEMFIPAAIENVGSESSSAERVQRYRARQKAEKALGMAEPVPALPPKTNAERQKAYRAKAYCEERPHVPYIEDWQNRTRYSGNYYIVFHRDKARCVTCGSVTALCVHHIDGYDESKPDNNRPNKMITLCRKCHANLHAGNLSLSNGLLRGIGYYDDGAESTENGVTRNVTCNAAGNAPVTTENRDKRKENRDKRIESREKREEAEDVTPIHLTQETKKEPDSEEPGPQPTQRELQELAEQFNYMCPSFKKIGKPTQKQKNALGILLETYDRDLLVFKRAFFLFENNAFLKRHAEGWATFDWLIKPENFEDVLKGRVKEYRKATETRTKVARPSQKGLEERLKGEGAYRGLEELRGAFGRKEKERGRA